MPVHLLHLRDIPLVGSALSKKYQSWRTAWQERAMRRLYSRFIRPGDLAFDVGANLGNRTRTVLDLGARVVAVEPQQECERALFATYGANPRFHLVNAALGAAEGEAVLLVANKNGCSTLSQEWVEDFRAAGEQKLKWTEKRPVRVTTLDALIEQFGRPAFIKIDTEAYDYEVLRGLSHGVPALSFEFHHRRLENAFKCIELLAGRGYDAMNYIVGEETSLQLKDWVTPDRMIEKLKQIPPRHEYDYGDVYAMKSGGA